MAYIKRDQVAQGIMNYAEVELLQVLDGWRLWTASAALVLLRQRADLILEALTANKMVAALGIVNANGEIDVDAAISAIKETANTRGKLEVDIPALGTFRLGESDFDTLREHILKAGQ